MTSMPEEDRSSIQTAESVLPCTDLAETLAFFTDRLDFRLENIFPADDPVEAVISGYGTRLRLCRGGSGAAGVLRISCDDPDSVAGGQTRLTAPNGTVVEIAATHTLHALPPNRPTFRLSRARNAAWVAGRAGMKYRDLIPGRQGGRFIASHIRIERGGPVPDYVHFHEIRFQMIFCLRGSVRVVYEDQGPPFVLEAGDCVLQPPRIRHRVLECSEGLEVIEIGSPAEHVTHADHDLALPMERTRPDRKFGEQRFVRHVATEARWFPWRAPGFHCRDTGIEAATGGLAGVRVVRPVSEEVSGLVPAMPEDAELLFAFIMRGRTSLHRDGYEPALLEPGDAFTLPPGARHQLADLSDDLEFLEVTVPA
jgi:mannose-6-phosphate isomerase-like protein (cupin superfamily)